MNEKTLSSNDLANHHVNCPGIRAAAVEWFTDGVIIQDQPTPHGKGPEIFPLVIKDIGKTWNDSIKMRAIKSKIMLDLVERRAYGVEEYGESLRANEINAKEEALNLLVYMRQGIEEGIKWGKPYFSIMRAIGEMYEECERNNKPAPAAHVSSRNCLASDSTDSRNRLALLRSVERDIALVNTSGDSSDSTDMKAKLSALRTLEQLIDMEMH